MFAGPPEDTNDSASAAATADGAIVNRSRRGSGAAGEGSGATGAGGKVMDSFKSAAAARAVFGDAGAEAEVRACACVQWLK